MKPVTLYFKLALIILCQFLLSFLQAQPGYLDYIDSEVIFFDDFTVKNPNWSTGSFDKKCWSSDIKDGIYEIRSSCDNYNPIVWTNSKGLFYVNTDLDFEIEAEIKFVEGENNNALSLIWGKKDDNKYQFGISGNGYYKIYKYDGEWVNFKDWSPIENFNSTGYNRVTVQKIGTIYNFFLNSKFVHSCEFMPFFGQQVGFQGNQNTTMWVNYFKIAYITKNKNSAPNSSILGLMHNLNSGKSAPVKPDSSKVIDKPAYNTINGVQKNKTNELTLDAQIQKLQSSDPVERAYAAVNLRGMKMEAVPAIPYLIKLLGDDTPLEWTDGSKTTPGEEAAYALGYELGKPAFEQLVKVMTDKDPIVRERAIWAIYEISLLLEQQTQEKLCPPEVVSSLINALKDDNQNVRLTAAWAMQQMNNAGAVEPLINILNDRSLSLIVYTPKGFVSGLGSYADIRSFAARALGLIGDNRAIDPLINTLNNDTATIVRTEAAEALGQIKDKRAYDPLLTALKDKNSKVIASAARGLGLLADQRAIEPLLAIIKDENIFHFSFEQQDIDHEIRVALELLTGKDFESICTEYDIKPNSTFENLKNVYDN